MDNEEFDEKIKNLPPTKEEMVNRIKKVMGNGYSSNENVAKSYKEIYGEEISTLAVTHYMAILESQDHVCRLN